MKKYLGLFALLFAFATPQSLWAQTQGDACSTHGLSTGGSVIGTTGSGASTVYVRYVCNGSNIYETERWTASARTNINIGTDSTATLNAACTQTGRLSYNNASSAPWLYCNGSTWQEFSLIPLTADLNCWGKDENELTAEYSPYKFKTLEQSDTRLCGMIANNRPVCVGSAERAVPIPSPVNAVDVDSANGYGCIINSSGTIKCYNIDGTENPTYYNYNYLSGPPTTGVYTDVSTAGGAGPEQFDTYSCAVKSDGSVSCWNWRPSGGTNPPALVDAIAVEVEGPNNSSHDQSSGCALRSGGSVSCWGLYGSYPGTNSGFTKIRSNGYGTYCGRRSDGSVACWGDNVPSGISTLSDAIDIAVSGDRGGSTTVCALRTGGVVSCWGDNTNNKITDAPASGSYTLISSLAGAFCVK